MNPTHEEAWANGQVTTTDADRLRELESQIESNIAMVGRALFEIRESRLYRITHKTFEDYCQERFAMNRRYINMQIQAASVMENLGTNGSQNIPTSERQARPLASLPKEDQPEAWEKAQDIAKEEGKPLAARHVEKAVAETKDAKSDRIPNWIPDDAQRLWTLARQDLNKILKTDKSRVRVLKEIAAYVAKRLEENR